MLYVWSSTRLTVVWLGACLAPKHTYVSLDWVGSSRHSHILTGSVPCDGILWAPEAAELMLMLECCCLLLAAAMLRVLLGALCCLMLLVDLELLSLRVDAAALSLARRAGGLRSTRHRCLSRVEARLMAGCGRVGRRKVCAMH